MEKNASLVAAAKPAAAGAIHAGPLTTPAITNATTALPETLKKLGHVSKDGLEIAIETSEETITGWGGDAVMTVRTSRSEIAKFSLLQSLDPDVLAEVYGPENVKKVSKGLEIIHNGKELPERTWVFEMLLTGGAVKRIVIKRGKISKIGAIKYVDGVPTQFDVELTAFPDEAGNTAYEYIGNLPS